MFPSYAINFDMPFTVCYHISIDYLGLQEAIIVVSYKTFSQHQISSNR